jgi:hypothetical protein
MAMTILVKAMVFGMTNASLFFFPHMLCLLGFQMHSGIWCHVELAQLGRIFFKSLNIAFVKRARVMCTLFFSHINRLKSISLHF